MAKAKAKPLPKKKVRKPVKKAVRTTASMAERIRQASRPSRSKKPTDQRMREATRLMPEKKARPLMPNDPITPRAAPTDYPPVGVTVSTGTAWDASIDPATLPLLNVNNIFTGYQEFQNWLWCSAALYTSGVCYLGSSGPNANVTVIQPGGAMTAPSISIAGSPVVTVALLDPTVVNERLAALEEALNINPPGNDPRSATRSTLTTTSQTNQDLNDQIFAAQRIEAQRVEDIFNPPS